MAVTLSDNPTPPETQPAHEKENIPAKGKDEDCGCDPPKLDTSSVQPHSGGEVQSPVEFTGDLNTNNEIPSQEMLNKIADINVLDSEGRAVPFKSIYTGPNVARRVLVIFIRHFFCGNCKEYIRTLANSITTDSLLQLPTPTFIAIIGCGAASFIQKYQEDLNCPFPIYTDPTRALYSQLSMQRTLTMGERPDYQRRGTLLGMAQSIAQGVKHIADGRVFQAGDMAQVGGEFLFEPVNENTPMSSPLTETDKQLGNGNTNGALSTGEGEEKRVTWCHRMRNTRDHAEIPELREVLGLDGEGTPGINKKRWQKALSQRKGTGLSTRSNASIDEATKGGSSGRASSEKAIGH